MGDKNKTGKIVDITKSLIINNCEDALKKSQDFQEIAAMDPVQFRGVVYVLNLMMGMQLEILKDYVCDLTGIIADLKGKTFSSEERQKLEEYFEFDIKKTIEMIKRQSLPSGG